MAEHAGFLRRGAGRLALPAILALTIVSLSAPQARAQCVGDCNGDGQVRINELILGVNIALGTADVSQCSSLDVNGDGRVAINELIAAVNVALSGDCPQLSPTPTPTSPTPGQDTPTHTPTGVRPNRPPVIAIVPPGAKTAEIGQILTFNIDSSDPDCPNQGDDCDPSDSLNDALTRMVSPLPLPPNATYDAAAGTFTFAPTTEQAGLDIALTFSVDDSDLSASASVQLTVPQPPGTTSFSGEVLTVPGFAAQTSGFPGTTGLAGVTLVLGTQNPVQTVSGSDGRFRFNNVPISGRVRLLIDGSTVDPSLGTFATVPEAINIIEGANNVLDAPIYLLPLDIASADPVDPNEDSIITSSPVVIEGQEFPAIELTVPAGTAMEESTGEMFDGDISISLIPNPILGPRPLPPEVVLSIYIAVQPFGVRYDVPIPIAFPNVEGFPIGTIVDIFGLNHDTGVFEVVGQGRAEADGMIHSGFFENGIFRRAGVVRENSWHGFVPQAVSRKRDPSGEEGGCKTKRPVGWPPDRCTMCLRKAKGVQVPVMLPTTMDGPTESPLELVYNLSHAQPEVYASVFASPGNLAPPPLETGTRLSVGGLAIPGEVQRNIQCSQFNCSEARYSHSADASDMETGVFDLDLELFCTFAISERNETFRQRAVVINEQQSYYGAGVSWAGLYKIHHVNAGTLLLTNGAVEGQVYRRATCADIELGIGETALYRFMVDADNVEVTVRPRTRNFRTQVEATLVENNLVFAVSETNQTDGSSFMSFEPPSSRLFGLTVSAAGGVAGSAQICVTGETNRISRNTPHSADEATVLRSGSVDQPGGVFEIPFAGNAGDTVTVEVTATNGSSLIPGFTIRNSSGTIVASGISPAKTAFTLPATDTYTTEIFGNAQSIGAFIAAFTFAGDVAIRFADDSASFQEVFLPPSSGFDELRELFDGENLTGYELIHGGGGRVVFNAAGYQIGYFDIYGNHREYIWEGDHLAEIIDFDGRSTLIEHIEGEVRITDKAGRLTRLLLDARNRLVEVIDPEGESTEFDYEDEGKPFMVTKKTSPAGRVMTFRDNGDGSLTFGGGEDDVSTMTVQPDQGVSAQNPDGSTTDAVRESDIRASITDGAGNSERLLIDQDGNATEIIDRMSQRRTAEYFRGLPVLKTLANRAPISFEWDERGRLLRRTLDQLNASIEFKYEGDNLIEVRDEEGNVTEFEYDERNRVTRIIKPDGVTALSYDPQSESPIVGQPTTITYHFGEEHEASAEYVYDRFGQLITYICPLGNRYDFEYNAFGYIVSVRLFGVVVWTLEYNLLGYITGFIDIFERRTVIEIDADGFIESIANAVEQFIESYVRDDCGRLIAMTYADGIEELFDYDENNNIIRITIEEQVIEIGYDILDRIETITIDGIVVITVEWDILGYASVIVHNSSRIEYFRDTYGRLLTERIRGTCQPNVDINYTWDLIGRLLTRRDDAGLTSYGYVGNELASVDTPFGHDVAFDWVTGNLRMTSNAGFERHVGFDANHRVESVLNNVNPVATTPGEVSSFEQSFDQQGNVETITFDRTVGPDQVDYEYDGLNQLTDATYLFAGQPNESFTWDPVGNRLRGPGDSQDATFSERNEIESTSLYTFENDDRGRVTRKTRRADQASMTFDYDGFDNLIRVVLFDGTEIEYAYDGYGRRIKKTVDDEIIASFVYSGNSLLHHYDNSGEIERSYTYGLGGYDPIIESFALGEGDRHRYLAKDPLCSITELVDLQNTDASATTSTAVPDSIVGTTVYNAFGDINESTGVESNFAYRGLRLDRMTGLYHLYSGRDYDPELGRTLQPSHLPGRQDDPLTLNPYIFARNNPPSEAFVEGALPGAAYKLHPQGAGHLFTRGNHYGDPGLDTVKHRFGTSLFSRVAQNQAFVPYGPRPDLASVLVEKLRGTSKCYGKKKQPPLILNARDELVYYYLRHARRVIDHW